MHAAVQKPSTLAIQENIIPFLNAVDRHEIKSKGRYKVLYYSLIFSCT